MTDLVTTFRAAKMAGVTRAAFQKKISSGELKTFEGMIHLDDLHKVFPKARRNVKADAMIDRMKDIQETASYQKKEAKERALPSASVLMQHLEALSNQSLAIKSDLDKKDHLIHALSERLEKLCDSDDDCIKHELHILLEWLHEQSQSKSNPLQSNELQHKQADA